MFLSVSVRLPNVAAMIGPVSPERRTELGKRMASGRAQLSPPLTQTQASRAAGIGSNQWGLLERGKTGEKISILKLAAIDRVLGWDPGTAVSVVVGEENLTRVVTPEAQLEGLDRRLGRVERVLEEIAHGLQLELPPLDVPSGEDEHPSRRDSR